MSHWTGGGPTRSPLSYWCHSLEWKDCRTCSGRLARILRRVAKFSKSLISAQRERKYSLIEIWSCPYTARFRRRWCRSQATVVARHFDGLGQTLREAELRERHAGKLAKGGIVVRDIR